MPSIYVKSYGCSANTADAEIARGLLNESGYSIVDSSLASDLDIVLTCVVKTPTEVKVTKHIQRLAASGKPLIVAGCMPKAMRGRVEEVAPHASMVGPDDLGRITEAVEEALQGGRAVFLGGGPTDRTCLPRDRSNRLVHIAPICTGCLGDCSYCIVKRARGRLHSFPAERVVRDVEAAAAEGCREVWVTAEDTAAYRDGSTRLPQLLDMITSVEGRFMVRVGMMTPNQALLLLGDLVEAFRSEKVYKFLHVPVQSGSDAVLASMRRQYKVADFMEIVDGFRAAYPDAGISTDIICGFPGETPAQFEESLRLVRQLKPDVLNISRYWERPGTEAATLPGKLHGRETKARSRALTDIWKRLAVTAGERWLGWEGDVLLTERGRGTSKVARNHAYKAVAVETPAELGETVHVRITGTGVGFLEAVAV